MRTSIAPSAAVFSTVSPENALSLGPRTIRTPTIPSATAPSRNKRTCSPRNIAAKITVIKGAAYPIAVTSGSGNRPRPAKPSPIAAVPTNPRQKCPIGEAAFSPVRRSPRTASQARITGNAKTERKKTACPAGTCCAVALISEAIVMKVMTEQILRAMPLSGCIWRSFWRDHCVRMIQGQFLSCTRANARAGLMRKFERSNAR